MAVDDIETRSRAVSFSAPRLTIYALLSSVEEDLRALIVDHLVEAGTPKEMTGPVLFTNAMNRYADENGAPSETKDLDLATLLPYVDIGDLIEICNRFRSQFPHHIGRHIKALNPQLELLLPVRKRIAHIRPFRYDDLARVTTFTDQVSAEHSSLWPSVTETVAKLSRDPAFVFDLPLPRYEETPNSSYHNLPLPEFDDTGFLGREAEVATVLSLCKGPWPVVSLVGEGGLGKTALALRCAYDLLDDPHAQYDAIIWSSSKTTRLDPTQIREIDGAIRDSLKLLKYIAQELGAPVTEESLLDEIIDYLTTFRVLLILDNLETVLDTSIRKFLGRLPAGSKILITSRIGVGEYEHRVNVQPLPNIEATRLLRAVAKVSGVRDLARLPEDRLSSMCDRMQNNPLFIKWFVSAIQAGVSPEESLVDPSLFLDFCMSNVYDHLSAAARDLLKALLASPEELSLPELIYFNRDDAYDTQAAVQELLTTNMMAMNSTPTHDGRIVETRYRLTELARLYLTRHHPLTPDEDRDLERARVRLGDVERKVSHQISGDPYEARTIAIRSRSDLLVVRPLLDALRFAAVGRFAEALDAVIRAKDLAPDYFECFRVEGQVHGAARNIVVADAAFNTAIGLASPSPALRFFYAEFLRESRHDVDGAIRELELALELDPGCARLLLEVAKCNLEVLSFSNARSSLDDLLLRLGTLDGAVAREVWRLNCDYYIEHANFSTQTKRYHDAIASLEVLRREVDDAPPSILSSIKPVVGHSVGALWCLINEGTDEAVHERARIVLSWLRGLKGVRLPFTVPLGDARLFGTVKYVEPEREFGFISSAEHGELFFHRTALVSSGDFPLLKSGLVVSYRLAASERGRKAIEVEVG